MDTANDNKRVLLKSKQNSLSFGFVNLSMRCRTYKKTNRLRNVTGGLVNKTSGY